VYALDYPGHGFSDIPNTDYDPDLFVKAVEGFLDKLDLKDVTLVGISIGGVIPLLIAAKQNPRVKKVIAINPYDYAHGMGITRANSWAWLTFNLARVPVLGETVMRLRNRFIEQKILQGGVAKPDAISPGFGAQVLGPCCAVVAQIGVHERGAGRRERDGGGDQHHHHQLASKTAACVADG